ncbi:uncharacterized protein LOC134262566 [Saccostrea cucullata]|uniref:uncharacterized protein LOC134262566 n=1 Tax=Saccostrea cuccullata TaxID=36930 RepID=UPI002ED4020E
MELISFFFVLTLQVSFSLTTGLINGLGICLYNAKTRGCCKNYKEVDGSCERETGLYDGQGVCKDFSGNMRCCTNYQEKENHCKRKWILVFVVNEKEIKSILSIPIIFVCY